MLNVINDCLYGEVSTEKTGDKDPGLDTSAHNKTLCCVFGFRPMQVLSIVILTKAYFQELKVI